MMVPQGLEKGIIMFCDENFLKIGVCRSIAGKLHVEIKHHYEGCYFGQTTVLTEDEAIKTIDVLLEINSGQEIACRGNVVAQLREEHGKKIVRITRDNGVGINLPVFGLRTLAAALCDSVGAEGFIRTIEGNLAGLPYEVSKAEPML